ncbi:MAG: hypothetical protein V1733_11440 [bacterium]
MKKLDINKIHILATEWDCNEPIDRIYVVTKTPDDIYDDPMTCTVEFDQHYVWSPQPFHQFLKFSYPVFLDVREDVLNALNERLLSLPINQQRKLIELYEPDAFKSPESIVSEDVFEYIRRNLLPPLSQEEFDNIETGFRLHWNYSTGQEVGDLKWAVGQYLTTMESPMDRKKMAKIVDLILEYLEGIGQWEKNHPF